MSELVLPMSVARLEKCRNAIAKHVHSHCDTTLLQHFFADWPSWNCCDWTFFWFRLLARRPRSLETHVEERHSIPLATFNDLYEVYRCVHCRTPFFFYLVYPSSVRVGKLGFISSHTIAWLYLASHAVLSMAVLLRQQHTLSLFLCCSIIFRTIAEPWIWRLSYYRMRLRYTANNFLPES